MPETINFKLNGRDVSLNTEGSRKLLWVLRDDFGLTGAKYGCGTGLCGACVVVVNNEAVRSCMMSVSDVGGREVLTIEGLAQGDKLHPIQQAFVDCGAAQCGFCTPGMIMSAYVLLLKNPKITREQIISGLENNLCRCAAHTRIVQAIESVAGQKG